MINRDDDYEKIDFAASYPDILGRGEFQPRSKDGEEKKQRRHISSKMVQTISIKSPLNFHR